jgi:phosphoglycolate phosphatase-like HAD superfamily hydrolase
MPISMARVRAILFDVDGTLADTDDAYIERVHDRLGPVRGLFPGRNARPFLRWALTTAISPANTLMGIPDILGVDTHLVNATNWVSDRFGQDAPSHFVLMPGVLAMLARLKRRHRLGVVTARSERATRAFLQKFDMGPFFDVVAHAQSARYTKPHADPIIWCAQSLGITSDACLMVGDTAVDIHCGRSAGAQTIGVLCGFGSRAELERAGADLVLEHTANLAGVLAEQG